MSDQAAITEPGVPSAEFVRSFARWRMEAVSGPVFIANHGRNTHVLLTAEQYQQQISEGRPAIGAADPFSLAEWIDEAVIVCDGKLRIESMNRVASAMCRLSSERCIGDLLYQCLPQLSGTLFEVHLLRTVRASELTAADIPSPLRQGGWLRLQTFPLHERNVIMFRDITEEVQRHRLADVKAALIQAMAVHNAIGYVRLSLAGLIDRVDQPFCDLMGLKEQRLLGAKLVDMVSREHQSEFKSALEQTLSGKGAARIKSEFLSNRGTREQVEVAMVQLHGAYGAEGAVILLTPPLTSASWTAKAQ